MRELIRDTVFSRLAWLADEFSERPALWQGEHKINYRELNERTNQLACGFLHEGIKPGSHVAIWGEPDLQLLLMFIALQKLGCVTILLNTCLKYKEAQEQVVETDTEFMVVGDGYKEIDFLEEMSKMSEDVQRQLKKIIYAGVRQNIPYIGFNEIVENGETLQEMDLFKRMAAQLQVENPAVMLATSGTTGLKSKLVVLSMFHLVNGGLQKAEVFKMNTFDIVCMAMPLFHIFCLDVNVMAALMSGACLYLPKNRRSREVLRAVQEAKCTVLNAVPSIFYSLLARQEEENYDVSSLRVGMIGGAYCPPEKFCEIDRKFGFTLIPGLGQTEAAAGIAAAEIADPLEVRSTTVGHIVDYMEARIVNTETQKVLPTGEAGEVCVRGCMLMMGYYKQPELTAESYDNDGYMHTGDIGYIDGDGYLHMKARIKDLINRGGEKINPNEIESLIMKDHRVRSCKVVPVPDEHYGEQACAVIECKNNQSITTEEVIDSLKNNLADYKIPAYVLFVAHIPRTATGKYRQKEIIKMAIEKLKL